MAIALKVLVDSSVWIKYFKEGDNLLNRLIEEDIVCTNQLILSELLPVFIKGGRKIIIDSLKALETVPLEIDWSLIRNYQVMNLNSGINRVGIPDLIILQQVIEMKLPFYSLDKHFRLMNEHLSFELVQDG